MNVCLRMQLLLSVAMSLFVASACADVKLPSMFSDHMVIQGDVEVPIWGWADPGETVTVSVAGQTMKTTANGDGKWLVKLNPLDSVESLVLTVAGKNTVTVTDVVVGDVWLCSGQSNMGMEAKQANSFNPSSANFPRIRLFHVPGHPASSMENTCGGNWMLCTPETASSFSAVAYFFGSEIHQKTGKTLGLINSSVGGTPIEAWTSADAQKGVPQLQPLFDRWTKAQAVWNPDQARADYDKQL